jgi:hypothetical protein
VTLVLEKNKATKIWFAQRVGKYMWGELFPKLLEAIFIPEIQPYKEIIRIACMTTIMSQNYFYCPELSKPSFKASILTGGVDKPYSLCISCAERIISNNSHE